MNESSTSHATVNRIPPAMPHSTEKALKLANEIADLVWNAQLTDLETMTALKVAQTWIGIYQQNNHEIELEALKTRSPQTAFDVAAQVDQ